MTVDGYYNDVTDKIVAFPTTYAWKMANYGKVHASCISIDFVCQGNFAGKECPTAPIGWIYVAKSY